MFDANIEFIRELESAAVDLASWDEIELIDGMALSGTCLVMSATEQRNSRDEPWMLLDLAGAGRSWNAVAFPRALVSGPSSRLHAGVSIRVLARASLRPSGVLLHLVRWNLAAS